MSESTLNLLLVDDEDSVREPLAQHLRVEPYKYMVKDVASVDEALMILEETNGRFDVALIDEVLKDGLSGVDLLNQIKARYPQIACILFTGWGMQAGLEALRAGAYRYFAKPFNLEELALTIRFAADQKLLQREREYLTTLVQVSRDFTQTTNLEQQLAIVWNYVKERLGMPTFFIALYDSNTSTLRFHQSYDEGEPNPLDNRHLGTDPSEWGVAGYVVKTGKEQVWFTSEQATQEWQAIGIMPHITGKGLSQTGICLPLQVGEKILGALSVQSYQKQAFDHVFLNTIRTLSGHIAPAIENAHLFQEIIQRTGEVETARDHLDRLIASSFDGIVTIDTSGIITGFNSMAERILDYEAKDVLGKPVRDLYYDLEEPGRIGKILQQSTDGKLTDYETDVKSKRGDRIHIRLSVTWLFDSQGNRIGSAGYFRDLRHIQETEMHRRRLLEANNAVAEAVNLEDGLLTLCRIMVESCIATFCSILLFETGDKNLIVRAAYPFPRSERLMWDPGIDKMCTPFREPGIAKMVMTDEPIVLRRGRKEADQVLIHLAEETKLPELLHSILIVPLRVNNRCLGICILGEMRAWDRSPITIEKIELAQSLANQAATFIEKMRSHELTQQRAELLEALHKLSLTISSSLNLDDTLNKTCQAAVELFRVDHSGLVLFDSDHVKGRVGAEYPAILNTLGIEIPLQGIPLEEQLIEEREPIAIFDVENEEKLDRVRDIMYGQFDIQSTAFVPVISKGELFGSFSLDTIGHKRQFTHEEIRLCKIFASHVASAIENAHLHYETEQRNQLLEALDGASRHIRAEKEPAKLLHEIVRLAAELMGCTTSGLFINHSHLGELELTIAYGLPEDVLGCHVSHNTGLIGSVARTGESEVIYNYSNWADHETIFEPFEFSIIAAIPLKHTGDVEAVLFIADTSGQRKCDKDDIKILERFAAQASIAVHTSYLMSKEQRKFSQLAILHRISDYVQEARDLDKILHVVLTGITAGYGLSFNRAALLLLDGTGKNLVGRMGIGYLKETEAKEDWLSHHSRGLEDFGNFLIALEQDNLPPTPVLKNIQMVQIPVQQSNSDALSRTILEQNWVILTKEELNKLPQAFLRAFEPALPFIIIPMMARGKTIGLLVADNKFTQTPITEESVDSLLTFVNTAAVAIDNVQLFQKAEAAREKIRASFEASNALVLSQPTTQLLEDVLHQTEEAAGASWVSAVLIDEFGFTRSLYTTGSDNEVDIERVVRPNGITMQVARTGRFEKIEDTQQQRNRVNPRMFHNNVAAALCLPFAVRGKQIGVVWIHYNEPHHFPDYEIEAIQLFVNQAAIAYDSARRMEELDHMRKAAEAMAGVLEPAQVLQQIVESASEVLQSDTLAIWSYDNVSNKFIPKELVAHGISETELERFRKIEPKEGGTAKTVMEQGWVGVTDISDTKYNFMGPSTRDLLKRIGAKSYQGVALRVSDEDLGVLYANYNRTRSFSYEDRRIFETFAYHAALALKKARLLEQVSKARDVAKVVAQVSVLEDLRKTLHSIVRGTQDVLGCDAVTLYTYDQDKDEFGFPPAIVGVEKKTGVLKLGHVADQSVVRNILALEKAHEAEDALSDPLMRGPFVLREQIKSSVGIPLLVGDRKVGVMFVNYRSSHRFTTDESTNIGLFANQAAVAIRNAQLHGKTQERAEMLEGLYEAGKAITSTLALDKTLTRIAEQALHIVGADPANGCFSHVALREGNKLKFIATSPNNMRDVLDQVEIDLERSPMIGIAGRAIVTGLSQNIPDVKTIRAYIAAKENINSQLSIPLRIGERIMGVLSIEHPERAAFDDEDVKNVELLAAQAGVAIENARLYKEAEQRADNLKAVIRVSKTVISSLDLDHILTATCQAAVELLGVDHSGLVLFNEDQIEGKVCAEYPEIGALGATIQLRGVPAEEQLIMYKQPLMISDVANEKNLEPVRNILDNLGTRSMLIVPVISKGKILGSFGLDNMKNERKFTNEETELSMVFAAQVAVAIENAHQYEELKQTKGLIGARTALAWMGMVNSTWRHAIEKHAITIRDEIELCRRDLAQTSTVASLHTRLDKIERLANQIREKPITPPLGSEEGVRSVEVNDLIQERVKRLWEDETYKSVSYQLTFHLDDYMTVRASPEWLQRAIDILMENAVDATKGQSKRKITIATQRVDNKVKVSVTDNGNGISPERLLILFREPIKKVQGEKGLGMGLLFAQLIAQTYGGDIRVGSPGPGDTTMIISLPLES